jgi:Flp pilus assembly CpaF family ATPase
MPILDKMSQDNDPEDHSSDGEEMPLFRQQSERPKPPPRPTPEFLEARMGRAVISMGALLERIREQFRLEHFPDDSAARAAATRADRLKLVRPVVDYVLAVESVSVDDAQLGDILRLAYSDLFGFGPLDNLIADESITTILLEGDEKVSVRRGHGELERIPPLFDGSDHYTEVINRLLMRAGTALLDRVPLVEVGFRTETGRYLSLNLATPPITIALTADIRLHPVESSSLNDLVAAGKLTQQAASVLQALVQSAYGFVLAGQPESGKTMMLSSLLADLPDPTTAAAIERTGELFLPDGMISRQAVWPKSAEDAGITFGDQVQAIQSQDYQTIVLDEVRADEPDSIAPLLADDNIARLIWSVRGTPDSKRLRASLSMLAQRADTAHGEQLVRNLFGRMPFVVSVRRVGGRIELREVGEWVLEGDLLNYQSLMETAGGETTLTGIAPTRPLPGLSDEFWTVD